MIKRIDTPYDIWHEFKSYGREDNFSVAGLELLLDHYDSIDENTELDVIAICCEWTEYDLANDVQTFLDDFEYLFEIKDYKERYDIDEDVELTDEQRDDWAECILNYAENSRYILRNNNIVVIASY